jgi:hypothetical protein
LPPRKAASLAEAQPTLWIEEVPELVLVEAAVPVGVGVVHGGPGGVDVRGVVEGGGEHARLQLASLARRLLVRILQH